MHPLGFGESLNQGVEEERGSQDRRCLGMVTDFIWEWRRKQSGIFLGSKLLVR